MKQQQVPLVTSQEGSRSCLLRNNSKNSCENVKKSTCFKCKYPFGLGHVRYAGWFSMDTMENENKAESMRRWRKEQKETKKAINKAHYKKYRKKLIKKAVERKQQKGKKAMASNTRARSRQITEGGNGKGTARVRKFRQNKAEKEEKRKGRRNTGPRKRLLK